MALISGVRITHLDENKSIAVVPYRWRNKNPFQSMYFAVQSMAAELSTAAPVFMALKGVDKNIAFIIVDLKAEFAKKAQSRVSFTCLDYQKIHQAVAQLDAENDSVAVTVTTTGRDAGGDEVAVFHFTWSLKIRP